MKKLLTLLIATLIFTILTPAIASAHQPRITEDTQIQVIDPEISKAYYSQLNNEPHTYTISSEEPFLLYAGVLVPALENPKKDISANIINTETQEILATLDGNNFEWTEFFEPFGYSTYWEGPEYEEEVPAGQYQITVSSINNDSKYSLAVGKIEAFNFSETANALKLIPELKRDFFEESPANFIFSPFGWGFILIMYIIAFAFGLIYRFTLKRLAKGKPRKAHKNISKKDRLLRLTLGIALLIWAITTSWNPILLFLSGFTIFEAIFSWCGLYAAMGKNSCPIN